MPISMRCPGCQTRFEFADDLDGKRIKCKSCGDIFRVADPDAAQKARAEEDRRRKKDDGDRKTGRYSRPVDDDRRTGRYRKPDPDEDDRPRSRRRDDDSEDDLPRRRDDEDDRPRKKKSNLLLILLPLGLLGLVAVGVIGFFAIRGKKKGGGPEAGDVVVAPSRSCPLEVPEKDVGTLVLPDSGTTFGLLRKTEAFKKSWVFEPYDVAAKRRVGKLDLAAELDDPKAWSLSPDGKQLLITEARGLGGAGDQWLWVFGLDGKRVTADRWFPYARDDKRPFDAPALHRAEFVANDKILTLATNGRTSFTRCRRSTRPPGPWRQLTRTGSASTPARRTSTSTGSSGRRPSPPTAREWRFGPGTCTRSSARWTGWRRTGPRPAGSWPGTTGGGRTATRTG